MRAFDAPADFRVYPIGLCDELPAISIPLLPGDTPIVLDLQTLLDRSYDSGNYSRRGQYDTRRVSPPLSTEQKVWVEQVLGQPR